MADEEGPVQALVDRIFPIVLAWTEEHHKNGHPYRTAQLIARKMETQILGQAPKTLWDATFTYWADELEDLVRTRREKHRARYWLCRFAHATGDVALAEVTPAIVRCYLGGPGVTPARAREHLELLVRFFDWCVGTKRLPVSPLARGLVNENSAHHPVLGPRRRYSRRPKTPSSDGEQKGGTEGGDGT